MSRLTLRAVVFFLSVSMFARGSHAQGGFKFPNPFGKKKSAAEVQFSDEVPADITPEKKPGIPLPRMPKMPQMPKFSFNPNKGKVKDPNKPSTIDKMNKDMKNFFSTAGSWLMPWNKKQTRQAQRSVPVTGTRRTYDGSTSRQRVSDEKPKTGFPEVAIPFIGQKKKESTPDNKPKDVNSFLKQPRPPID